MNHIYKILYFEHLGLLTYFYRPITPYNRFSIENVERFSRIFLINIIYTSHGRILMLHMQHYLGWVFIF